MVNLKFEKLFLLKFPLAVKLNLSNCRLKLSTLKSSINFPDPVETSFMFAGFLITKMDGLTLLTLLV